MTVGSTKFTHASPPLTIPVTQSSTEVPLIAVCRLPMPYHPVFNVERFALASRDRYFLAIAAADPKFDRHETESFLNSLNPAEVSEVAA